MHVVVGLPAAGALFLKYCTKTGNTTRKKATIPSCISLRKVSLVCITISQRVQSSLMLMKVLMYKEKLM